MHISTRLKNATFKFAPTPLYLRMYVRDTDRRVNRDPKSASGRPEEIIAPQVLEYLKEAGLKPHHKLLDFGCGTIRTGKYIIDFLNKGCYAGVDISQSAIQYAQDLISDSAEMLKKEPQVWMVSPFQDLRLRWTPDFIACHSVFTHLPKEAASRTFEQLRKIMGPDTVLIFTAFIGDRYERRTYKNFFYSESEIIELTSRCGLEANRDERSIVDQSLFLARVPQFENRKGSS